METFSKRVFWNLTIFQLSSFWTWCFKINSTWIKKFHVTFSVWVGNSVPIFVISKIFMTAFYITLSTITSQILCSIAKSHWGGIYWTSSNSVLIDYPFWQYTSYKCWNLKFLVIDWFNNSTKHETWCSRFVLPWCSLLVGVCSRLWFYLGHWFLLSRSMAA